MALVDVIIGYAKGAQGDVGPQGPTGPQGPEGPQGPLPPLINNALATTAGVAALDAVMGKTLQDQITQTNSNLELKANSIDVTTSLALKLDKSVNTRIATNLDFAFDGTGTVSRFIWNDDTLNTPKTSGVTIYGNGYVDGFSIGSFIVQSGYAVGDNHLFIRAFTDGAWSSWRAL